MDERAMEMTIEVENKESWSVLHVTGEVDVFTAPRLRERLVEIVDGGTNNIVVDLEGVEFLDSTGLGVLVGALKRVKTGEGVLALVCTKDKILKLFRITGLEKVFPIHDTVDAALAAG